MLDRSSIVNKFILRSDGMCYTRHEHAEGRDPLDQSPTLGMLDSWWWSWQYPNEATRCESSIHKRPQDAFCGFRPPSGCLR